MIQALHELAYHVEQLSAADYDQVIGLWQRAGLRFRPRGRDSRESFGRQLESGAQEGDQLVGVVTVTHDSRKGWINRLAVEPGYRHRGIGTRLIAAAEGYLRCLGIDVIAALVLEENTASQTLFARAGYQYEPRVRYLSKRSSPES